MQSGRRDTLIQVQSHTETKNKYGEVELGWILFKEVWANKRSQSSREIFQTEQLTNLNVLIFTTLFFEGANSKMRIISEGKTYDIRGIQEIGRRKEIQFIAEENGESY